MKVLNLVKLNDSISLVLDSTIKFSYKRYSDLVIGVDETDTFVKVYKYAEPTSYFKAFGGAKFNIELEDGELIHCNGQWWDSGYEDAQELLKDELYSIAYSSIDNLKDCYCFNGCSIRKSKYDELIKSSEDNKVYDYYEFESKLKKGV